MLLENVWAMRHRLFEQYSRIEKASGFILFLCAVAALLLANLPKTVAGYHHVLTNTLSLGVPGLHMVTLSTEEWIKEGLMTIFFFVVGIELKHEFLDGELSRPKAALLPIAAALGGMIAPAALYWLLNRPEGLPALSGAAGSAQGWPVPMATDIAFAVAALSVVARRLPR
ncbi:MAG TPA: Na+/H+ antiporter NhaA, partial [Rhizomicrobium sp.]